MMEFRFIKYLLIKQERSNVVSGRLSVHFWKGAGMKAREILAQLAVDLSEWK